MIVYDASAIMAWFKRERGWDVVRASFVEDGGAMSIVNLGEVLSKLAVDEEDRRDPAATLASFRQRKLIGDMIRLEPFTEADMIRVAELRPLTSAAGASLGDRACLALAQRLRAPVLTSDRPWTKLRGLGIEVRIFRSPRA